MLLTRQPSFDEHWRDAEPGEMPSRCASLMRLAQSHGWTTRVTYAKGTPTGPGGEGMATVMHSVPLESEDGRVLMTTPPRKKDGSPGTPRPRTRRVDTDIVVVVELVTLWLERGGRRLVATWIDGKGQGARSSPPGMTYKEAAFKAVLRSDPAMWESLSAELADAHRDAP